MIIQLQMFLNLTPTSLIVFMLRPVPYVNVANIYEDYIVLFILKNTKFTFIQVDFEFEFINCLKLL